MQDENYCLNRKKLHKGYMFLNIYFSESLYIFHHPGWAFSNLCLYISRLHQISSLSLLAHHKLFGHMLNAMRVPCAGSLGPPLTPHSAHWPLSALIEPPLHLMACLILIETEQALEVKYILMHFVNPFIK